MASNSAIPIAESAPQRRPARRRSWNPFTLGDQPFFEDKNRAFWILQSAGWAGYFVLRTLSNIGNAANGAWSCGAMPCTTRCSPRPAISITLLMASAFRRLIRMKPVYTWVGTIVIVVIAAAGFSAIETWSYRHLRRCRVPPGGTSLPRRDPAHRLAADRLVGALLQHQLFPAARGAERPAGAARKPGVQRPARHAALPAQSALPVQHAQFDLDPRAAEADRPGQRDAVATVLVPALHAGQREHRPGHDRPGDRDSEALSRDRDDALRGAAAAAFPYRAIGDPGADPLAAAPAADRECDQICGDAAGRGRRHHDRNQARRATAC